MNIIFFFTFHKIFRTYKKFEILSITHMASVILCRLKMIFFQHPYNSEVCESNQQETMRKSEVGQMKENIK